MSMDCTNRGLFLFLETISFAFSVGFNFSWKIILPSDFETTVEETTTTSYFLSSALALR